LRVAKLPHSRLAGHTYTIPDRDARFDAMVQTIARPNEHREQTLILTGVNEVGAKSMTSPPGVAE